MIPPPLLRDMAKHECELKVMKFIEVWVWRSKCESRRRECAVCLIRLHGQAIDIPNMSDQRPFDLQPSYASKKMSVKT